MTVKTANVVDGKEVSSITAGSSDDDSTRRIYGIKDHWKCLAACTMVSMCPFQYGMSILVSSLVFCNKYRAHKTPE